MTRTIDTSVSQLAEIPKQTLATVPATPESMLEAAIAAKMDPAAMKDFYELFRSMKADQARAAFHKAFAAFKAECPQVPRRSINNFFKKVDRDGVQRASTYASIEDIEGHCKPYLAKHGLSTRWGDVVVGDGFLSVCCIVSHEAGHSESSSATMPIEANNKNSPQHVFGSAETYAMRRSLARALGVSDCDDTDGNSGGEPEPVITAHQAANLEMAVDDVGGDKPKFLQWLGVTKFSEIPVSRYETALKSIEKKRKGAK